MRRPLQTINQTTQQKGKLSTEITHTHAHNKDDEIKKGQNISN